MTQYAPINPATDFNHHCLLTANRRNFMITAVYGLAQVHVRDISNPFGGHTILNLSDVDWDTYIAEAEHWIARGL